MFYRYSVQYRRRSEPNRIYRTTVTASDADNARRAAAIADPDFGSTVKSPQRRAALVEPESADPITAAKARDDLRDGVAHFSWLDRFDIEVEVV